MAVEERGVREAMGEDHKRTRWGTSEEKSEMLECVCVYSVCETVLMFNVRP